MQKFKGYETGSIIKISIFYLVGIFDLEEFDG